MGSSKVEKMEAGLTNRKCSRIKRAALCTGAFAIAMGCASKVLKYDKEKAEALKANQEFSTKVKIDLPPEEEPATESSETVEKPVATTVSTVVTTTTVPKKVTKKTSKKEAPAASQKRQPEIESAEGFSGRRPIADPFRVGEKVIHDVTYLGMSAGKLNLEVRPYAHVNQRKAYQFRTSIKTSSLFSSFYSVDDYVNVLMDFETLVPSVFTLHVKETSQLKEAQMLFDSEKNVATYWEKKVTKKDGETQKKIEWEILPYSQNVFSTAFYMRFFQWKVGDERVFRVADDKKNLTFKGKAVRKETIETEVGTFEAIVIKPEIELKGKFQPTGDNFIWLSDDDRKFILRIESKIKIGTLVSEISELHRGN